MKKFKTLFVSAVMVCAAFVSSVPTASAGSPLRFGIKAGMNVSQLSANKDMFSSDNRSGFTGGLNLQFTAPIINIGVDASVMYTHRNNNFDIKDITDSFKSKTFNCDYIEIPVNFRYNLGLPLIGKVFTPYVLTGPDFSFRLSNENVKNAIKYRSFDVAWNFGLGFRLIDHLELGATYGIGITQSASGTDSLYGNAMDNLKDFKGKNRFWTVTATWLF